MAGKPNVETILSFYSHDELLELAKVKTKRESDARLADAKKHLDALASLVSGAQTSGSVKKTRSGKKPGRPKGSANKKKTAAKKTASAKKSTAVKKTKSARPIKRAKNKISLAAHLIEVIGKTPMTIPEIQAAIKKNGYKSNSKNPKRILYLELSKQSIKGTIQSKKRGIYTKK